MTTQSSHCVDNCFSFSLSSCIIGCTVFSFLIENLSSYIKMWLSLTCEWLPFSICLLDNLTNNPKVWHCIFLPWLTCCSGTLMFALISILNVLTKMLADWTYNGAISLWLSSRLSLLNLCVLSCSTRWPLARCQSLSRWLPWPSSSTLLLLEGTMSPHQEEA